MVCLSLFDVDPAFWKYGLPPLKLAVQSRAEADVLTQRE